MTQATIQLCGQLLVELEGRRLEDALPGRQGRMLFAHLVVNRSHEVSREELIEAIWPGGGGPAQPEAGLSTLLSRLRSVLPDGSLVGRHELRLQLGPEAHVDVEECKAAIESAREALAAGDWDAARSGAEFAIAIAANRLLPGLEASWLDIARRELDDLRLEALEILARAGLGIGGAALPAAERAARGLIDDAPLRELAHLVLMEIQAARGNYAEALRSFEAMRRLLAAELGAMPSEPARDLHARLLLGGQGERVAVAAAAAEPPARPAAVARPALPRPLHLTQDTLFVGRDAEYARVRARWLGIDEAGQAAVLLAGEAGIGKTRLASQLASEVHEQGGLVLYGRCDEGLAVPYQPFVEALRPVAQGFDADRLRAGVGGLAAELGRLWPELGDLGQPLRADAETERYALFEAVAALISAATRDGRALIVLDDLHWATNPTLLLVRHLMRSERPLRALLLGTYRETDLDPEHPMLPLLADLGRDANVEHVSMEGLDEQAIAELLRAAAGDELDERSPEFAGLLHAQTGGNAFFVRELLAHLVESGALSGDVTAAQLDVPEGLRQVIGHRVARLSRPARRALNAAAVAGPTASLALLERVLGDGDGVLDALEEAVAGGLLVEAGHGEYGFAHVLVRGTIYRQLSSARRMRLHRQIGEALEALLDEQGGAEALAHHFAEAAADGQGVKASAYALAAGRSASARLGHEEAAGHYARGLKALAQTGQPPDTRRCELLLALSEARWSAAEIDKAREACMQAAELAEWLGDAERLATAALGFGGPQLYDVGPQAYVELLERALAALGEQDSALRAQVMGRLAAVLAYAGVQRRRPQLGHQALQIARRVADDGALADVLATSHWATREPDNLGGCITLLRELAGLAAELGDGRLRAYAHVSLLDHLLELGDIDGVDRELAGLQRLADSLCERYPRWLVAAVRAKHALVEGRLADCERLAIDALAHGCAGQDEPVAQAFGAQMAALRREQGRLGELVEIVEGVVEQYPELTSWRCGLAYVYGELDRADAAAEQLELLSAADFGAIPRDGLWVPSMSQLAETAVYLDDTERAERLYELLLPYADRCIVVTVVLCHGALARTLGLLAATIGRYEEAAELFEIALERNARIRSRLWVAHTQHGYAWMLLRRGGPGDAGRARALLGAALASAEELGLDALARRVRQLSVDAEAAVPRG